jgi:hypothetical protein
MSVCLSEPTRHIIDLMYHICLIQVQLDVHCILFFYRRQLYIFPVLFAPIIRSSTAAYSHRLCVVLVCYSIGAGTGLGHPHT